MRIDKRVLTKLINEQRERIKANQSLISDSIRNLARLEEKLQDLLRSTSMSLKEFKSGDSPYFNDEEELKNFNEDTKKMIRDLPEW